MSIKAVTFRGAANFNSNLYALEMKTRFIDQSVADGYFEGYGKELAAVAAGNQITVGSGAFVVQGRVAEIDSNGAAVTVSIEKGNHGYVCARIETYPASGTEHCSLIVKTGASLSDISLIREDTYMSESEYENKVYELPLYSFYMTNDGITNLERNIPPLSEVLQNTQALLFTHHLKVTFKKPQDDGSEILYWFYCDVGSKIKEAVKNKFDLLNLIETVKRHSCTGVSTGHSERECCMIYAVESKNDGTIALKTMIYSDAKGWRNGEDILSGDMFYAVIDTVT